MPSGCQCACHRFPGVAHLVACCAEPPYREAPLVIQELSEALNEKCRDCTHERWQHLPAEQRWCSGVSHVEDNVFDCTCQEFVEPS